ncbi:hypothetical protein ABBQ32_006777 [Trebouxia sp. C0010 RCD-2024]
MVGNTGKKRHHPDIVRGESTDGPLTDGHSKPVLDGLDADGPVPEDRLYSFCQLPDHVLLRIFRDIEAIPKGAAELDGHGGPRYQDVTDDTLTVLTDGHQRRSGLPLVCKQWYKLLSQPSFVWADLNIGFHELWFLQQRFVDRDKLFRWVSKRSGAIRHIQLDFDAWCRQYYQGAFSALRAGASVAALLELVKGSLQELKVQDMSFVVNAPMLHSLAAATNLQHLQLFGVSSQVLVSDTLTVVTQLSHLKNLELADSDDHRDVVQQQHSAFFPTQICDLPNLITLHIQSSLVTYIDPAVTKLTRLQTLMLNGCSLENISSVLTGLTQLQSLCLADNVRLAVNRAPDEWWPLELDNLMSLKELDLSSCGISGVPVALGKLAKLSHLDLGANGAAPGMMLPLDVGACYAIRSLCLNDCSLRRVPDCLCLLTQMRYLGLANNQLLSLPQGLVGLGDLRDIDLAHNHFTEFPTVLAELTSLDRISFKGCTSLQIAEPLQMLTSLVKLTALIFTCDLSRLDPRWSADSTSNLISLALDFAIANGRDTKVLRL